MLFFAMPSYKEVHEVGCGNLPELLEKYANGETNDRAGIKEKIISLVQQVPKHADLIVYARTHFLLANKKWAECLPSSVKRVGSVKYQAEKLKAALGERAPLGNSKTTYLTTGDPKVFATQVQRTLEQERPFVHAIDNFGNLENQVVNQYLSI